jgi:hypothetical protein
MIKKSWLSGIKIAMAIVLISFPSIIFACSCAFGSDDPEAMLMSSDIVFKGKVIAIEQIKLPPNRGMMQAKFNISVFYKGAIPNEVYVRYRPNDGLHCGIDFIVGEEVTAFVYGNLKEGFWIDTCATGNIRAHDDIQFQSALEAYRNKQNPSTTKE